MEDKITLTKIFLEDFFNKSSYYQEHEDEKNYRLEHSYRVSAIGKEIAIKEGMNVEAMVVGCLLHDISYGQTFKTDDDWLNHGRDAAKIARPFLESLGYDKEIVDEVCYGIAIHVDDKADFPGERSAFALTIGEADNIDRFDVYRIYENLQNKEFNKLAIDKKKELITSILDKLEKYIFMKFSTSTAQAMWLDKINFQIEFFKRLEKQLKMGL